MLSLGTPTSLSQLAPADPQPPTGRAAVAHLRRRDVLGAALLAAAPWVQAKSQKSVEVWKGPTCGCCVEWIKHLESNGFQVKAYDTGNSDARARLGIPVALGSCHTALVDGYVIEGHVPARDVRRLLSERPKAVGLAVPGMPIGSPGMDGPSYGGQRDPYDVLLVLRDGSSSVYHAYR